MKVAQVVTLFRPDFVGGATLVCERITHTLLARGHRAAVFCGRPDPHATPYGEREWTVGAIPVTGVNVAPGYAPLDPRSYRHPEVVPAFERFLARTEPDVVHFHSIQALGADLLAATAARALPIVVTLHDWWWFCARLFLVDLDGFVCPPRVESARCHCAPGFDLVTRRRFLTAMLAHADRVLVPSQALADAARANGVAPDVLEVCPNGVAPSAACGDRRPGPVRFGYFGGPDNRLKGLPTLLAAADRLAIGGWELVLHGVVPGTPRIPPACADRVRCRPRFPPEQLADVLADLDVLVVPSLMRESYSLVTREALAAGVPVVTSDSGGPAEIVTDGVNGTRFATGDATDLAAAMRRLVREPAWRTRLRAGARATTVPTVARQVEQLERIYATVAGAPRSSPPTTSRRPAAAARATAGRSPAAASLTPPRAVLFVTGIDGAPRRYRVTNLQDQLALHGIASRVLYFTDPAVPSAIAASDLVVMYRVPACDYVRACLAHARQLGRPLVFSCDDLVFDPAATPAEVLARLPPAQQAGWRAYTARYAETLAACDAFLGTTAPLVAAAARAGVAGFVVPNGLGVAQLAVAESVRKQRARTRGGLGAPLRVAYLSGTITHDLDFAAVEPALAAVLAARPGTRLRLVGYLRIGPALAPFRDRVERLPFLPWPELLACLAEVDVNLAPLAAGPFAEAKSAVKYLEAAVLGVPTIASPTAGFRAAIRDGETGLFAADSAAWERALGRLLGDAGLRRRLGNAARDDAFLHYTPEAQAPTLVAALSAAGAGRAPSPLPVTPGLDREDAVRLAERYPGEVGRYDFEPDDASPGAAQPSRDTPSPFLTPGRSVGQTFRCAADGLYRIDLCVGTDGRRHPHRLVVHLAARPGPGVPDLAVASINCTALADNGWVAAEFAPLGATAGSTLYVWVESEGAHDDDAVVLWTYVQGWGEAVPSGLHIDHRPAAGSLTFRTFHRPSGRRPADAAPSEADLRYPRPGTLTRRGA